MMISVILANRRRFINRKILKETNVFLHLNLLDGDYFCVNSEVIMFVVINGGNARFFGL